MHFIKFGYCDERPGSMWFKHKNRNKEMCIPRILGRHRTSLKFINTVFKKYVTTSETFETSLDINNLKQDKKREKIVVYLL